MSMMTKKKGPAHTETQIEMCHTLCHPKRSKLVQKYTWMDRKLDTDMKCV